MKILTKRQLERVRELAAAADALVSQAEAIVRGAHRSWRLRFHLKCAQDGLVNLISDVKFGEGYYDPPRTRKVERMEELERRCEMHGRDNHGFPRASRKTGGPTIPGGMGPSGGKHKETQDEQGKDKTGR